MKDRATPVQPVSEEKGEIVNLLVSDIDMCLLTFGKWVEKELVLNPRADLLSQAMIDLAKVLSFAGFILCTHRYYEVLFRWLFSPSMYGCYVGVLGAQLKPQNLFTKNIVQHFSAATGLSCFAVSTPDDLLRTIPEAQDAKRCGYAYAQVTGPYEERLLQANQSFFAEVGGPERFVDVQKELTCLGLSAPAFLSTSKNRQYLQVAQFAAARYPLAAKIFLHIVDDIEAICRDALTLDPGSLPGNVVLLVIRHNESVGVTMQCLGQVVGTGPMPQDPVLAEATARIFRSLTIEVGRESALLQGDITATPLAQSALFDADDSPSFVLGSERSTPAELDSPASAVPEPDSPVSQADNEIPVSEPLPVPLRVESDRIIIPRTSLYFGN
jgi:hypothetical protein